MSNAARLKRTSVGIELVRRLAAEGERIFSTDRARQLAPDVGLSNTYLWEALHHLRQNGWIVPLKRGLYSLSSLVPGVTPVHEFEVAMALVSPAAISHWSALHHHGLTEQLPRRVFVLTAAGAVPRVREGGSRRSGGGYPVGDITYQFVQVKQERYFGIERIWVGEVRVAVTDPERTLLDGLAMPKYCGDIAEVLHAFEVRAREIDLDRIIRYAIKLGPPTAKRLGWVLEHLGFASASLDQLADVPMKGYRKLDPAGPRAGPHSRRWMIQENLPGWIGA